MADVTITTALLAAEEGKIPTAQAAKAVEDGAWWRVLHAFAFLLGGTTFIAGTYYIDNAFLSALLYTIGSAGFLTVDVQEFFTFSKPLPEAPLLRHNICLSAIGSFFYIVGSVGFLPCILAITPAVGIWGFIAGSFFIGVSQLWKTHRIASSAGRGFSLRTLWDDFNCFTAAGVELSAGLGAWCFFFGTGLYQLGPLEGPDSVVPEVLQLWMAGSLLFTLGGLFLAYRHAIMNVA